jgi:hypothetical protein
MRIFYNPNLFNIVTFRTRPKLKRVLISWIIYVLLFLGIFVILIHNLNSLMIYFFFLICLISMTPLKFAKWFGFFDMNNILTIYASMQYGLAAGLFVGTASVIGLFILGDVDSLHIDLMASSFLALLASPFSITYYVPVMVTLCILYLVFFSTIHYISSTFNFMNITWAALNLSWVLLVAYKIIPLLT